ncbi:hypothetical protein Q4543_05190 [Salipiger sp. 1_MG-2023]|uniref:hypothetical protein n=1 Tax=Salipiger sp. 1_MG-2023 TaxID=3062665 RepID=UPI0026E262DD|nr:hypothetical protein [Salipiger sp. 1_MG-2023]MDO6584905.1 hypothetical protein [Salipiger sp. 1_MG-2023]
MSIKRIAKQALSAYARSKTQASHTGPHGSPVRHRPIRTSKVKRGRSMEGQLLSKVARSLRKAF